MRGEVVRKVQRKELSSEALVRGRRDAEKRTTQIKSAAHGDVGLYGKRTKKYCKDGGGEVMWYGWYGRSEGAPEAGQVGGGARVL